VTATARLQGGEWWMEGVWVAKEARGDAESCETRCSAERAKAFWKGLQLRTGSAWGLAMADASSSVAGRGREGWWYAI
jgi:hypothetical protein